MTIKVMFAALFIIIFSIVSCDANAHVTESDCQKLVKKLPPMTQLDRVGTHHCIVAWNTLNGYSSTLYKKKFKCTYNGHYKYSIRDLPGKDKYGNEYRYSREGFKYIRYYACPTKGTGHIVKELESR